MENVKDRKCDLVVSASEIEMREMVYVNLVGKREMEECKISM